MTSTDLSTFHFDRESLIVVGVSGGSDSLALLHVLYAAGYPLLVASFNHRLRPEAETEIAHVQEIAEALGLPFVTASAEVAAYAEAEGRSVEQAARELRYRFLFQQARQAGAQAVAVGHTADDQAETVLMHFLRGAGLAGLKGMPPRLLLPVFDAEIPLVRPLLAWTHAQTEAYCRANGLRYLVDSSNRDTAYFRNRLRHELLPHLEQYNPQIRQALARSAQALQGDYALLDELSAPAWEQALAATGSGFVAFDLPQLRGMSPALRRNLFRRAIFTLKPDLRDVNFDALERAASLQAVDVTGGLKTLPEGDRLYLTERLAGLPSPYPQISRSFSVTRDLLVLGDGWVVTCQTLEANRRPPTTDRWSACFDAALTEGRLQLRPYQVGDRFEPLGMPGQTVKLSDLFVNLKIPQRLRAGWPVVCVEAEIVWVPGLRMGQRYRCSKATTRTLCLRLEKRHG